MGFAGIYTSEEYGGSDLGRLAASAIFEALAWSCPSITAYISIHNMNCMIIDKYGTTQQKENWLHNMTNFNLVSSYCLTEPGSGSDAQAMKGNAKLNGDDWVLNGSKAFISGGSMADIFIVMMKTSQKGISCFYVPSDAKGIEVGKNEEKMGWNAMPTNSLTFDDVKIPKSNLIGEEGKGFSIAMEGLNGGRINIASCSLGGAWFALEKTHQYMSERQIFGQPLKDLDYLAFKYSDALAEFISSRLIVREAATAFDEKNPEKKILATIAKLLAAPKCSQIVDFCLQAHGGYGYLRSYEIEKTVRDLRVHQILEGSSEVMRLILSREQFKQS